MTIDFKKLAAPFSPEKAPIGRPPAGQTRSAQFVCPTCGATFRRKLSQVKGAMPCCSAACAREFRRNDYEGRFWRWVDRSAGPDGCWIWMGTRARRNYGRFSYKGRTVIAHRFALQLSSVEVPPGSVVMHICDNPPCVNPSHLRVGTWKDNIRDMYEKGRNPNRKGENHPYRKLSADQVRQIRRAKGTQLEIARQFGVSRAQVYRIRTGKNWGHING